MDKKKYEISVADVDLAILSDEREDFVNRLVSELDTKIRQITLASKRCSTLDAAILVALDASGEKLKADKRIRTLEAQIGLYDANLRRVREENQKLKEAMLKGTAAPVQNEEPLEDADEEDPEQVSIMEELPPESAPEVASEERAPEPAAPAVPVEAPEKAADAPASAPLKADKLRQIESLLRGRN